MFEFESQAVGLDDFVNELVVDLLVARFVPEYQRHQRYAFRSERQEVSEDDELVVASIEGDIEFALAHQQGVDYSMDRLAFKQLLLQYLARVLQ